MKRYFIPIIIIFFMFWMYNTVETRFFTDLTVNPPEQAYPRNGDEAIADGLCFVILAIAMSTLAIVWAIEHVAESALSALDKLLSANVTIKVQKQTEEEETT